MEPTAASIAIKPFKFITPEHAASAGDLQSKISYLECPLNTAMFHRD
jgi:hypothetical protein